MEVATENSGKADALKVFATLALATPTTDSISDLPEVAEICCRVLESRRGGDLTHLSDFWPFVGAAASLQTIAYQLKVGQTPIPEWIYLECDIKCDLPCDADRVREVAQRVLDLLDELAGKVCTMRGAGMASGGEVNARATDGDLVVEGTAEQDAKRWYELSPWEQELCFLLDSERFANIWDRIPHQPTGAEVRESIGLWHEVAVRRRSADLKPTPQSEELDVALARLYLTADKLKIDYEPIYSLHVLEENIRDDSSNSRSNVQNIGEMAVFTLLAIRVKQLNQTLPDQPDPIKAGNAPDSGTESGDRQAKRSPGRPRTPAIVRFAGIKQVWKHEKGQDVLPEQVVNAMKKNVRNWIRDRWDDEWWNELGDQMQVELLTMREYLLPKISRK